MIGKTILHYKIIGKLGAGGMGVVYLAEDTKLKRKVAIKFLPGTITENGEGHERFKLEAQAAAALNHPNITQIYAIEESGEEKFIVMEFVKGKELKSVIETTDMPAPAITDILDYATQIASGLQAAHELGIVHRDIKPTNIMISDKGQVKIMDFGLAKISGMNDLTKSGSTLGTTAYLSPEQIRGEEVDNRTDIWSFGIVLFELFSGIRPFKGDYDAALMYEILNEGLPDITTLRPDLPGNIVQLLSDLLKKDRDQRVCDANEIITRLRGKPGQPELSFRDKSIAVLYFENMSPDKENEYFCAGMTEDIIIDLSKIHELKVIPRSDILPFKGNDVNSRKIGEILKVNYILEGSVRKAGQQIRVTSQLINVQTGFQIWAERYDRHLEDIFEVQIELSQKIAEALKVSLSDSEKELLAVKPTEDLRAHDFYMRGREFLTSGGKKNNESAIKMFELALSIDPNYSLAYVALSEAYSFQYTFYDGNQKWLGMIISASEKAKLLDPDLLEVELTKGIVFYHQKRFTDAKKIFEEFIKQKDDYYPGYFWLGITTQITKEYDAALSYFNRASEIKPYSEEPWIHIAMIYHRMKNDETEKAAHEKVLKLVKKKMEVNASDVIALSRAAVSNAILGNKNAALEALDKVMEIAPNDGLVLYNCACTCAQLNKKEESFVLLRQAIDKGYNNIIEWVENDPDFENFRDDPQFKEILSKNAK